MLFFAIHQCLKQKFRQMLSTTEIDVCIIVIGLLRFALYHPYHTAITAHRLKQIPKAMCVSAANACW